MEQIITIGREFGSGGRELGHRLAETLGCAYYDQEIVTEIANRTELSEQYVRSIVEQRPVLSFPIHVGRTFYPAVNPSVVQGQRLFQEQCRLLSELSENRGPLRGLHSAGQKAVPHLRLRGDGQQNSPVPPEGPGGRDDDR